MYRVRLVCEGPTDLKVLEAVLYAHLEGDEFVLSMIQPVGALYGGAHGPHGGGWKGVRAWCQSAAEAGGMEAVGALGDGVDLLVIHVDSDIGLDEEHGLNRPCPPPCDTVKEIEALVLRWLGLSKLPDNVILWIPCMATEAWVLRALHPTLPESVGCLSSPLSEACVECLLDPATELIGKAPRLVRRKAGTVKKIVNAYGDARVRMSSQWADLKAELWTAQELGSNLDRWLPRRRAGGFMATVVS